METQTIERNGTNVSLFERNWHGATYTVVKVETDNGEVEVNVMPAKGHIAVSPNRGDVRAYSPHPYDEDYELHTATSLADRLHLTDEGVWGAKALKASAADS